MEKGWLFSNISNYPLLHGQNGGAYALQKNTMKRSLPEEGGIANPTDPSSEFL